MTARQFRAVLIVATLAIFAASYFPLKMEWRLALAGVSAAVAVYGTIVIASLATAFRTVSKGAVEAVGADGRLIGGLLVAYPLYRIMLVLLAASLAFFNLHRAWPGLFFDVPPAEDNPLRFIQLTAESLFVSILPDAMPWQPTSISVATDNPWSRLIAAALLSAPVAMLVELVRAWATTVVVFVARVLRASSERAKKRRTRHFARELLVDQLLQMVNERDRSQARVVLMDERLSLDKDAQGMMRAYMSYKNLNELTLADVLELAPQFHALALGAVARHEQRYGSRI